MKGILVMLNEENYVIGYCENGFTAEGYSLKSIDEKYLDKYEILKNGETMEQKYEANEFFKENMIYFKEENNELIFDEVKKKNAEKLKKESEKRNIQNEIINLEMKKQMFIQRDWDTREIEREISKLENELQNL